MAENWNAFCVTGRNGNDKYVKLTVSNTSIRVSNRGEILTDNITLNAYLKGMTLEDNLTITWSSNYPSEIEFIATEYDNIKELNNATVLHNSVTITVTVVHSGVTYTDSMTIDKVYEQDSPTQHLGIQTGYPMDADGKQLVNGDSFVLKTTNGDDFDYVPYVWNGTSWVTITDESGNVKPAYANVLMESATSILDNNVDVKQSSAAIYGYFKNLVATNAFIENLTTHDLLLNDGGSIRSEYFNANGTINTEPLAQHGLFLSADGIVKLANGYFLSEEFSTQKSGENNVPIEETVNISDYDISLTSAFLDNIILKATSLTPTVIEPYNSYLITGNYKGTSFSSTRINKYNSTSLTAKMMATIESGILYIYEKVDEEDFPFSNDFGSDSVLSSDICYADYDAWHLEDIPEYKQALDIHNVFYTNIPLNSKYSFYGSVSAKYKYFFYSDFTEHYVLSVSQTFSLTDGKVKVTEDDVFFYNSSDTLIGSINKNVWLETTTSIDIIVDAILVGITSMNITPYSHETYDVGQSTKRFNNGYYKNLYSDTLDLPLPATLSSHSGYSNGGYVELPNQMILQFAKYTSTSDDTQTFNFPISFPNACLSWSTSGMFVGSANSITATTSSFSFDRDNQVSGDVEFYVIAIGY